MTIDMELRMYRDLLADALTEDVSQHDIQELKDWVRNLEYQRTQSLDYKYSND